MDIVKQLEANILKLEPWGIPGHARHTPQEAATIARELIDEQRDYLKRHRSEEFSVMTARNLAYRRSVLLPGQHRSVLFPKGQSK
jgi:hypothetical protein